MSSLHSWSRSSAGSLSTRFSSSATGAEPSFRSTCLPDRARPRPVPLAGAAQLLAPLLDVRRDPDRSRLARDRPLAGLADPPRGVGRELETATPVELLDC